MPTPADKISSPESDGSHHQRAALPIDAAANTPGDESPFKFPQHAAAIEDRMLDEDWREFFKSRYNNTR